jgi:hypothetical protein
VLGFALLIAVGVWGVGYFNQGKAAKRQTALAEIDLEFRKELEKNSKEREVIERELEKLTAENGATKQEAESAKNTLQGRLRAIKADHSGSAQKYREVYQQFSEYPEGWLAGVRYASYLIKSDKLSEGKEILAKILLAAKGNVFFQVHAGLIYLGVLEDLKDYDGALAQIDSLLKQAPDDLKAKLLLTKSRVQAAKRQVSEARQTLESVIKDYSSSPEAERAWGMKAMIN